MITPAWILDIFAAVMLVVAVVSAARLAAARPWQRGAVVLDTDIAHLVMAIAMAGMLAASLRTLPGGAWEVTFGVLTAWFGYRVMRDARTNGARALAGGRCAPHLVHSAAMLYMFLGLAAGSGPGMSAMGASSGTAMQTLKFPTMAFVFALLLVGYSVWDLDLLSGMHHRPAGTGASFAFPGGALAGVPALAGAESPAAALPRPPAAGAGMVTKAHSQPVETEQVVPGGTGASGGALADARGFVLSPGITIGCRIAMGVTMAFMLLITI